MKIHTLRRVQVIPRPLEEVFDFFRTPENLRLLTPAWLDFRILTPGPITMKEGTLIDYTIGLAGFRLHWRASISTYDPPHEFVDQQLNGPYLFWHHRHMFRAEDGGTEMTDTVTYALPFGVLGSLVHALVVRRQLREIFDYRELVIAKRFTAASHEVGR